MHCRCFYDARQKIGDMGLTYGHTQFTIMFIGANFDDCCRERWMHAAFEGPSATEKKEGVSVNTKSRECHRGLNHRGQVNIQLKGPVPGADSPPSPVAVGSSVEIPAIDAILITRDGISGEAAFWRRGRTLYWCISSQYHT